MDYYTSYDYHYNDTNIGELITNYKKSVLNQDKYTFVDEGDINLIKNIYLKSPIKEILSEEFYNLLSDYIKLYDEIKYCYNTYSKNILKKCTTNDYRSFCEEIIVKLYTSQEFNNIISFLKINNIKNKCYDSGWSGWDYYNNFDIDISDDLCNINYKYYIIKHYGLEFYNDFDNNVDEISNISTIDGKNKIELYHYTHNITLICLEYATYIAEVIRKENIKKQERILFNTIMDKYHLKYYDDTYNHLPLYDAMYNYYLTSYINRPQSLSQQEKIETFVYSHIYINWSINPEKEYQRIIDKYKINNDTHINNTLLQKVLNTIKLSIYD